MILRNIRNELTLNRQRLPTRSKHNVLKRPVLNRGAVRRLSHPRRKPVALQLMQRVKHAARIRLIHTHPLTPLNPLTIRALIKNERVLLINAQAPHFAQLPATTRFAHKSAPPSAGLTRNDSNLSECDKVITVGHQPVVNGLDLLRNAHSVRLAS